MDIPPSILSITPLLCLSELRYLEILWNVQAFCLSSFPRRNDDERIDLHGIVDPWKQRSSSFGDSRVAG